MDTILEKNHYIWIYRSSHLALISFLYSLYQAHYTLAIVPCSVFITSLLYWQKPDYSYRRTLDMVVVKTCGIYQYYVAYSAPYGRYYYMANTVGLVCYLAGIHYYSKKYFWASTLAHIGLHVFANIANVLIVS